MQQAGKLILNIVAQFLRLCVTVTSHEKKLKKKLFATVSCKKYPVCERRVNLLVYSLSLHRHSYIGFILAFASSIHNKQTKKCQEGSRLVNLLNFFAQRTRSKHNRWLKAGVSIVATSNDRVDSSDDPPLNGHLRYPNNLDQSLNDTSTDKLRKYRSDKNFNSPRGVGFIPSMTGTSVRLHSEFIRILFLQVLRFIL